MRWIIRVAWLRAANIPHSIPDAGEYAPGLVIQREVLVAPSGAIVEHLRTNAWIDAATCARDAATRIHDHKAPFRETVIRAIGAGGLDVRIGTELLETTRWYRRTSKHIERITAHLSASVAAPS